MDDLIRVFNTALVNSRVESGRDFSTELYSVMDSPAFRSILGSIRQLARSQGIHEKDAAEEIVRAFRKLDSLWTDFLLREGLERVKAGSSPAARQG